MNDIDIDLDLDGDDGDSNRGGCTAGGGGGTGSTPVGHLRLFDDDISDGEGGGPFGSAAVRTGAHSTGAALFDGDDDDEDDDDCNDGDAGGTNSRREVRSEGGRYRDLLTDGLSDSDGDLDFNIDTPRRSGGGGGSDGTGGCDTPTATSDVIKRASTLALADIRDAGVHHEPFNSSDAPREQALRNSRLELTDDTLEVHTEMPAPPQALRTTRAHLDQERVADFMQRLSERPDVLHLKAGAPPIIKGDAAMLASFATTTIAPSLEEIEAAELRASGPNSALAVNIRAVRTAVESLFVTPYNPASPHPVLTAMRPADEAGGGGGGARGMPLTASGWMAATAAVPVLQAALQANTQLAISAIRRTSTTAPQAETLAITDCVRASIVQRPVAQVQEWCYEAPPGAAKCASPTCIVRTHLGIDAVADKWPHADGSDMCVPCCLYNDLLAFVLMSTMNIGPRLARVSPWTLIGRLNARSTEVPLQNLMALPEVGNIPCVLIFHPNHMRTERDPVTQRRRIVIPELTVPTGFLPPTTH